MAYAYARGKLPTLMEYVPGVWLGLSSTLPPAHVIGACSTVYRAITVFHAIRVCQTIFSTQPWVFAHKFAVKTKFQSKAHVNVYRILSESTVYVQHVSRPNSMTQVVDRASHA